MQLQVHEIKRRDQMTMRHDFNDIEVCCSINKKTSEKN